MVYKILTLVFGLAVYSMAVDLSTVFAQQSQATFPDTVELRMRTTIMLPGQGAQQMEVRVLSKGKDKNITEIKSPLMNLKMIRNGKQMGVVDLKTGQVLPTQSLPTTGFDAADINQQFGSAADYLEPVRADSLWKLTPKDPAKPILYYHAKQKRIVKSVSLIEGVESVAEYSYCTSCDLPGTLSAVTISTAMGGQGSTAVKVEVLTAKRRSSISESLFTIPQ